jgi:hypothetical protein
MTVRRRNRPVGAWETGVIPETAMTRSRLTAAALAVTLFAANAATADPAAGAGDVRQACAADFQKACPDAKPGDGALKACAKAHFMSFSGPCKSALKAMRARMQSQAPAGGTQ